MHTYPKASTNPAEEQGCQSRERSSDYSCCVLPLSSLPGLCEACKNNPQIAENSRGLTEKDSCSIDHSSL